ncbi:hypothetical protein JOC76_003252 [Neobacillus cucumis]|nr:hypothetical protein [Neobacillus cucumis]
MSTYFIDLYKMVDKKLLIPAFRIEWGCLSVGGSG